MDSGSYQLFLFLEKSKKIKIGKLGTFLFPKGFYVYTGSAMKNLSKRVERHKAKTKKKHWHIDYFIIHTKILDIKIFPSKKIEECIKNLKMLKMKNAKIVVFRFGNSDCTKCPSHLIYFKFLKSHSI